MPEDEIRPVTAVFADVVGSTALAERLDPEEVKALVGDCIARICYAVEEFGGVVRSHMGDGIAAFFGFPRVNEDDRERAAHAALQIRRVTAEYSKEIALAWGIDDFSVRVGVNCGRVATGYIGSAHPHLTALGDAVNVAARLQAIARPGTIVVGPLFATEIADRFRLKSLGSLRLKGRSVPVQAWELIDEAPCAKAGAPASLVGRSKELAALNRCFVEARSGRGQIALVVGEPGIGKTRLISEFGSRGATTSSTWLQGRCVPTFGTISYRPFVDMLRAWLGVSSDAAEVVVRVRLWAKISALLPEEVDSAFPHLAKLLGLRLENRFQLRMAQLPTEVAKSGLRQALCRVLRAIAEEESLIVVIDDFDRADESTAEMTSDLLALTDAVPLMLILSLRPGTDSFGWYVRTHALGRFPHRTSEILLGVLSNDEAHHLIDSLDMATRLTPSVRSTIVARAEGNPLYVEELVSAVGELGDVGSGELVETLPMSPALEAVLLARIDALPSEARVVLQVGAVCGRTFLRAVVEDVLGSADLDCELALLLRAGLVREYARNPDVEYEFRHGLIRQTVLTTLTSKATRNLHGAVAEALEKLPRPIGDDFVEQLSHHYAASHLQNRAIAYLEQAGDRAADIHDNERAIGHFSRAGQIALSSDSETEWVTITVKQSQVLARMGEVSAAAAALGDILDRTDLPQVKARVLVQLARVLFEGGSLVAASRALEKARRVPADPRTQALITCLTAKVALRQNDYPLAERLVKQLGRQKSDRAIDILAFEEAALWTGICCETGRFDEAESWANRGLAIAEELGVSVQVLQARRNLALIKLVMGQLWVAKALLQEVYETSMSMQNAVGAMESASNLLWVCILLGELRSASELGQELNTVGGSPFWNAAISMNLGALDFELLKLDEARAHFERAIGLSGDGWENQRNQVEARIRLAAVDLHDGLLDCAQAGFDEALQAAERMQGRFDLRVFSHVCLAEVALAKNSNEDAEAHANLALAAAEKAEVGDRVSPLRLLGRARERMAPNSGREKIIEALNLSRGMGLRLEEGRALAALGECGGPGADQKLDAARELFEKCGARRDLEVLARMIARDNEFRPDSVGTGGESGAAADVGLGTSTVGT